MLMYRLQEADRRGFENRVGLSECIGTVFQKDQSPETFTAEPAARPTAAKKKSA